MWEYAALLVLAAAAWFWMVSLRARERAVEAGRSACSRYGVQLLDDTVAISRLALVRDLEGVLRMRRVYSFEFSATGDNRRAGTITMTGEAIEDVSLEPYEVAGS